ncbi:hypothetical protein GCM10009546_47700 [Actinomadura livida]|uniref:Uncharacterized protein n=1 Tax=Actinomadura livida TaxID=79909 RepID=A0ABN1F180_9ACTN|nr:hypothetical protein GCM10010208_40860 [Actinomadura livida]
MVDILHRIGIEGATPDEVYQALTTVEGLAGWWTAAARSPHRTRPALSGPGSETGRRRGSRCRARRTGPIRRG